VKEEQIVRWLTILPFITAILLFVLMLLLVKGEHVQKLILKSYEEFSGLIKTKAKELTWYQRTERWLVRNGASYHLGNWITPVWYLSIRLLAGGAGLVIGNAFSAGLGCVMALLLFLLPGWLISYLNKKDNEKMLPQLRLVYHGLEIQIRAGVYVTDALAECYGCVRERRLKQALLDMAGDIVMKADIYTSLEEFQGKFDNRHIDALCITILQALESGQAVELLSDLAEQIKDMELTVLNRKKAALDRSITFYQLGILAAVLGVVLYACVTQMFQTAIKL